MLSLWQSKQALVSIAFTSSGGLVSAKNASLEVKSPTFFSGKMDLPPITKQQLQIFLPPMMNMVKLP